MPDEQILMPVSLVEAIAQFLVHLPLPMAQSQVAAGLVQGIQAAGAAHNQAAVKPPAAVDTDTVN